MAAALAMGIVLILPQDGGAIVGRSSDAAKWQDQAVMVLSRSGTRAGFCSGVVLAPTIIFTAGHCVVAPGDTRIYVQDHNGRPHFVAVSRVARHPGFRPDAPRTRSRSVDLALVQTADALPQEFAPPVLAEAAAYSAGAAFEIAGFGVSRENDPKSSGVLRSAIVALRPPLSSLLLWLDSAQHETGACTGDSGAPVFDESGKLAAIIAFAEGSGARKCGALTQAVLIAPHRAWINGVIAEWR